jgi:hypothetical protein
MQRLQKHLRIAVTVVFGLACVCALCFWIRSYRRYDSASCGIYSVDSTCGQLLLTRDTKFNRKPSFDGHEVGRNVTISLSGLTSPNATRVFMWCWLTVSYNPTSCIVWLPYWIPTYLLGAGAILPWIKSCVRFSVRALLLAMAALAALFAVAVNSV